MLASAARHDLHRAHRVVAFDLGLTTRDRDAIARRFPWCRVEPFDFAAHPDHLRELWTFAWKPSVIWQVMERGDGPVLWFDSATIFRGSIDPMVAAVARDGI